MIGETIKDFAIAAQLGSGGMGEVFVGEHRLIKTKVAIKMLRPEISIDKAHVDRFFNEAIAVGKIDHAGIVKIFDVGFHNGRAYLVMEFLKGEPLASRLRSGLAFAKAIEIARQVTSVLDATHAAGITHRDLKPDNIFLVPDAELGERVKILDFGIAKLGGVTATAAAMSMGTPAYMAPELWTDAATSGSHTDVYALGCVLFELCCGRTPFTVTAISEACGKHLTEVPPRVRSMRPELPQALDDLIAKMLEKSPAARATTKEIASVLAGVSTAGIADSAPGVGKQISGLEATAASDASSPARYPRPQTSPSIPPRTAIGHDSGLAPLPRDPAISDDDAALVERYEREGRWMDAAKLLAKQAEVVAPANRAAFHLRIAEINLDRFANQSEAIRAYERVLEHESANRRAIEQLRSLYEKRRDWEKLLELEKGELDRIAPEKRADKAVDIARLAASRVGKPDVTTYWWQRVLDYEADHRQAHAELAKSFERGERWMDLVAVLEHQAELAAGNDDRIAAWKKIATIREDKLADTHGTRDAWQRVLEIDPQHAEAKRAVERLTKEIDGPSRVEPAPKSSTAPAAPVSVRATKPSAPASEAAPSPVPAPTAKSPLPKILLGVAVLAIAGIAIYVATRGGDDKIAERDIGTPSPRLLQVLADKRISYRVVDGRVLVPADAPDIQIVAEAEDKGGGSTTGGSGSGKPQTDGSASVAQASGLTLSYRVLMRPAAGGDFRMIKSGDELHTDDRLVFEVMVSEQAHLYVGQRLKGKFTSMLFPNAGIAVSNPLPANTWVRLPPGDKSFRINADDIGQETAYFIASRAPIKDLELAIKREGVVKVRTHDVDDEIVKVAMAQRTDCVGRGREIVLDGDDSCKAKTRGIELDDEAGVKPAKRVRGTKAEDAVFVPFSFKHVAKPPGKEAPTKVEKSNDAPAKTESPKPGKQDPDFDRLLKEAGVEDKKPKVETATNLTAAAFKSGMSAIYGKVQACYKGTAGTAVVKLTIAPTGRVTNAVVVGQFSGTPVGTCVETAVKSATFPSWDGAQQSFNYSFLLSE